ncbi:MAG: formate dehydrogenase subunit gamma [Anaerolineae bacterium]|jgi:formate dehydrogenase subunit gamma
MSVRLRDKESVVHIRWIPKYTLLERLGHWMHAGTYVPLAFTGFLIFAPGLKGLTQGSLGENLRVIHRIFAVAFGLMPILYAILQPKRLGMNLRENFCFDRTDLEWLKAAAPYYLLGRHTEMPPQPRFNTGERLNAVTIIVGTVVFGITGLLMWFGRGYIPVWLFQAAVITHDLAFIATMCMFVVHLFLAVAHPLMWQSMVSMRFGVVSESYAREHHAKWYYGEKRAMELWEQHKAELEHQGA